MNRIRNTFAVGAATLAFALSGCGGNKSSAAPDAQVSAALRSSAHELEPDADVAQAVPHLETLLGQLRALAALAPMFERDHVPNPMVFDDDERAGGLVQLLDAVKITLVDGTLTITNRETGAVIFTGPVSDLASGTFNPGNLPGGTGTMQCTYTYSDWSACQSSGTQTRTVVSSTPSGCTGMPVLSQPCTTPTPTPTTCTSFTYSAWAACQSDGTQTRTVLASSPSGCTGGSPVTSQSCTYTPPTPATCTSFTYSAWGACQSDNTQTRTVLTSSPSGCTGGSPVLTQSCTYTPPLDGAALYTQSCSSCHGPLATSNLKGKNISVSLIQSRNMTQGLSTAQLQAIVDAVGP